MGNSRISSADVCKSTGSSRTGASKLIYVVFYHCSWVFCLPARSNFQGIELTMHLVVKLALGRLYNFESQLASCRVQAIALSLALAKESKPTASRDTMDQSCASGSQPLKESERDAPEGKAHPSYMVTEDGKSLKPLQAKGFPINSHAFPASSAQLLTDMTPNIASNPCTKDDNVQKATDLTSEEILTSEQKYEHKTRGCEEPKTNIESGNVKISRRGTSSGITPIKGLGNVRAAAAQAAKAQKVWTPESIFLSGAPGTFARLILGDTNLMDRGQ